MAVIRSSVFVTLVVALAVTSRVNATFCDLSGEAVCGADGIEYTNECVARIQGVKVAHIGECGMPEESSPEESSNNEESGYTRRLLTESSSSPEESSEYSMEESSTENITVVVRQDIGVYIDRTLRVHKGQVSYVAIKQFQSIGYRFVGVYQIPTTVFPLPPFYIRPVVGIPTGGIPSGGTVRDPTGGNDMPRGVYLDRSGQHYVQEPSLSRPPSSRTTPSMPPAVFRRRQLLNQLGVIGNNDLTPATPASQFPYSAVVSMVFTDHSGQKSGCTAAFISPTTLITAAHCVYNQADEFFYPFDSYTLYKSSGEQLIAKVDKALVTTQFVFGDYLYDVGLIVLDKSFKDTMGYLGHGPLCQATTPESALLGYPVDKGSKSLYQSTCSVTAKCSNVFVEHTCDALPGMEGGPLITRKAKDSADDNIVRAVLLGAMDSTSNTATAFTPNILAFIDESISGFQSHS